MKDFEEAFLCTGMTHNPQSVGVQPLRPLVFDDPNAMTLMVDMNIRNNIERSKLSYFSQGTSNLIDDCW